MNPSAAWKHIHGKFLPHETAIILSSIRPSFKQTATTTTVSSSRLLSTTTSSIRQNARFPTTSNSISKSSPSLSPSSSSSFLRSNPYISNPTQSNSSYTLIVKRAFASSSNSSSSTTAAASSDLTANSKKSSGMMDKIKDLVKKYGYVGVAVYLGISTLDLAATFVVVKALGMEKIEQAQDWVIDHAGHYFGYKKKPHHHDQPQQHDLDSVDDEQVGAIYNKASGLWSVFVIAYGIHKLLVPLRVVATSVITPPLVKWLIKRGWMKPIVKKSSKTAAAATAASEVKP